MDNVLPSCSFSLSLRLSFRCDLMSINVWLSVHRRRDFNGKEIDAQAKERINYKLNVNFRWNIVHCALRCSWCIVEHSFVPIPSHSHTNWIQFRFVSLNRPVRMNLMKLNFCIRPFGQSELHVTVMCEVGNWWPKQTNKRQKRESNRTEVLK